MQAKPNAFNYGTLGPGSYPDLFLRWVNREWGADIVGVPYRGGGPIAQELVAGRIADRQDGRRQFPRPAHNRQDQAARRHLDQALAGSCCPTCRPRGSRPCPIRASAGEFAAPKGTPAPIVAKLNAEFVRVFTDPKFTAFLAKQAVVPAAGPQADFVAFLQRGPARRRDAGQEVEHAEERVQAGVSGICWSMTFRKPASTFRGHAHFFSSAARTRATTPGGVALTCLISSLTSSPGSGSISIFDLSASAISAGSLSAERAAQRGHPLGRHARRQEERPAVFEPRQREPQRLPVGVALGEVEHSGASATSGCFLSAHCASTLIFFAAIQSELSSLSVDQLVAPLPCTSPASIARWIFGVLA